MLDDKPGTCPCGERHCFNCGHMERHHNENEGVCACCDRNEFEAEAPPWDAQFVPH